MNEARSLQAALINGGGRDSEAFGRPRNDPCIVYECIIFTRVPKACHLPSPPDCRFNDAIASRPEMKIFKRRKTRIKVEGYQSFHVCTLINV